MYYSKDSIAEKGQKSGRGRYKHLQLLVTEFQDCDKEDSKVEILANLANFAYDPLNFEYLRKLNVLDLFIDMLEEQSDTKVEYAIGGLCNITVDPVSRDYVITNGLESVIGCLSSCSEEVVLNAITTLINLITPNSKEQIISEELITSMEKLMKSTNTRLKNLATIFVEDHG